MSPACPAGASLAIAWSKSPLGWIVWQVIVATLAPALRTMAVPSPGPAGRCEVAPT
jgi:hypothetical protein